MGKDDDRAQVECCVPGEVGAVGVTKREMMTLHSWGDPGGVANIYALTRKQNRYAQSVKRHMLGTNK